MVLDLALFDGIGSVLFDDLEERFDTHCASESEGLVLKVVCSPAVPVWCGAYGWDAVVVGEGWAR